MPALFPAVELTLWLIFAVSLVLVITIRSWLGGLFHVIDSATSWVPFAGGWIHSGENYVIGKLNVLIAANRAVMSALLSGTRWSLLELVTGIRDFADYVASHWQQLVEVAIPGGMQLLWAQTFANLKSLGGRIDGLAGDITDTLTTAKHFATAEAAHALQKAQDYADGVSSKVWDRTVDHVHGVYQELSADITTARTDAETYADTIVKQLGKAEDTAIATARTVAAAELAAAVKTLKESIGTVSSTLTATAKTIETEVANVQTGAAAALSAAETAIETDVASAAKRAADALAATAASLSDSIANGVQAAEQAATTALTATASTLTDTITDAKTAAATALTAATATLESELGTAAKEAAANLHATATALEGAIGVVQTAEQAVAAELTHAEAAAAGELADIYNLPADRIKELLDRLDLTKVIGFGAGLVLVKSLVEAIATEAGLDSAACRAKHKEVCGVDPSAWSNLLGGAALLEGALSLSELVPVGRAAVRELGDVIRLAA